MAKKSKSVAKKASSRVGKKSVRRAPRAKKLRRKTIVSFILDETGSMESCKASTIMGFNEYVGTLRKKGENIVFTLTKFNAARVEITHQGVTIDEVVNLTDATYRPTSGTPLYDAVGNTIRTIDAELKKFAKDKQPAVFVVIMTDGEENSSRDFGRDKIVELISEREKAGWDFVYQGADHNAFQAAKSIGISIGLSNIANYTSSNVRGVFAASANATSRYSSEVTRGIAPARESLFTKGERAVVDSTVQLSAEAVSTLISGAAEGAKLDGATTK